MDIKKHDVFDNAAALRALMMLCTPFKNWDLCKNGTMDENGNFVLPKNKRLKPENRPNFLQLFVRNVKRLINKLPGGENMLKNIIAGAILIKENYNNINPNILVEDLNIPDIDSPKYINDKQSFTKLWMEYVNLKEEGEGGATPASANGGMPANNISSGKVATYDKPMMKMFRRKKKVL